VLQDLAKCSCVLQCDAVCCSVFKCGIQMEFRSDTVVCCSVLQCVAVCCSVVTCEKSNFKASLLMTHHECLSHEVRETLQHTATHCNTLHCTAAQCNTLHCTAEPCNTVHHTAAHCSTLQHTAAHCSTLQHTLTLVKGCEQRRTHHGTGCRFV